MTNQQTSLRTESETKCPTRHRPTTTELHASEHEQNDNWEWSDEVTDFIASHVDGFSLKVCSGLRPICDVNLDIEHLGTLCNAADAAAFTLTDVDLEQATTDSATLSRIRTTLTDTAFTDAIYGRITASEHASSPELYDGYACSGDMFDLPFSDNTFDTVVADPPWLELSHTERQHIFDQLVRVTKPTGSILYNATWIPTHNATRRYDLRIRQQRDFWGAPSIIACYRRRPETLHELFTAHGYDSPRRYPAESPFWSERFHPNAVSQTHNTDPKIVSPDPAHDAYCCPMCDCTQLDHLCDPEFETDTGEYTLYECVDCGFRATKVEIHDAATQSPTDTSSPHQTASLAEFTHKSAD